MPLRRLEWSPGFNSQATQTKNKTGWLSCNLVRWRFGLLEKLAGWHQLFATTVAGIVRAIHAYEDLLGNINLLIAGDGGAQIYVGGTLHTFSFNLGVADDLNTLISITSGTKVVTVTQSNFGLLQVGGVVEVTIKSSIGGHIFNAGTSFVVTSVTPHVSFTFNIPSNATRTDTNVTPVPRLHMAVGASPTMSVFFESHGLSNGNSFVFDATTNIQETVGSNGFFVTIPVGSSVVVTVVDADNFTFDASPYGYWFGASNGFMHEGDSIVGASGSPVQVVVSPYFIYAGSGPSPDPAAWFLDNFGTYGVVTYTGGPIYIYTPPVSSGAILNNAGVPNPDIPGSGAPQVNNGAFVAMPQAQIIAFGSEVVLGGGQQDPLLIRFSDAGSFTSWTADATNQAGSFRLGGSGTHIVGGFQAPQTTVIWTDNDVWSMSYVGTPFVYSFSVIASQCGLISPKAFALIGRTTWWMSTNTFYTFDDSGIKPVECPLWDIIFNDLDTANQDKIFLGASQSTNEVWIFYPSISGGLGECDKYLKVNIMENLWDYGSLRRSAWLAESAFGTPLGAETNTLLIQQHERGYDANALPMSGVYAETGYSDLDDGEDIQLLDRFIPDMKWFGSDGAVGVSFKSVMYPGSTPSQSGTFMLDPSNRYITPRIRARQIALRFEWAARLGFSARLGTPRARTKFSGKRP